MMASEWSKHSVELKDIWSGYDFFKFGREKGPTATDRKTAIFLCEAVLSVAIQTNAILLVSVDSCSLAKAWGDFVADVTTKRGGKAPFNAINVGHATNYYSQSLVPWTIAYQLRLGSKRWRHNQKRISNAVESSNSKWRVNWKQLKCPPAGCSYYIITDAVNDKKNKVDLSAARTLMKNLTAAFAKSLPSIGVVTLRHNGFETGALSLSNYVRRGLPLLMLDSRDRPQVNSLEEAEAHLRDFEARLNKGGMIDNYKDSNWSFLHTVLQRIEEQKKKMSGADWEGKTEGLEIFKVLEDHVVKEKSEIEKFRQRISSDATIRMDATENLVQQAVDLIKDLEEDRQTNDMTIRTRQEIAHFNELPDPRSIDELDEILLAEIQRWNLNKGRLLQRHKIFLEHPHLFKAIKRVAKTDRFPQKNTIEDSKSCSRHGTRSTFSTSKPCA